MSEAGVLYSDVKFTREKKANVVIFSLPDTTYSEVTISKTQPSKTESPEGYQQDVLSKRSKVTSERLALLVLSGLLVAAVIGMGVTMFDNIRLEQMFKKQGDLKNRNESGNTNVSEREPCSTVQPTCPQCPTVEERKPSSTVQPTFPKTPDVKDQTCDKCEEGWEQHGGTCYNFSISKSSWNKSRDECRAKGGDLVKIDSREEQNFLQRRVSEIMTEGKDKFWIGLTDSAVEGRWLWVDGSPLNESLKFWKGTEPDNWKGTNGKHPDGEDCVRMGEKGEADTPKWWFDAFCSNPHKSICEKAVVRGKFKKVCD
ncbi:C-type lectin domain family 10 member A isoform X2 [Oreochromis niloticus]|uniref:CD209 antigen-like protein E n=1 Tax=Oreochromis niloticus TaxID=8128 RepID=A0A669DLE8_ORENI|nr:C-type lectin domain family 10 member A isoform X2 [Oreochromis niloticus]